MLKEDYSDDILLVMLSVFWAWSSKGSVHKVCKVSCNADIWVVCSKMRKTTVARLTSAVARKAAIPNLYENNPLICTISKTKRIFHSVFIFLLIHNNVKKLREHYTTFWISASNFEFATAENWVGILIFANLSLIWILRDWSIVDRFWAMRWIPCNRYLFYDSRY